MTKYLMNTWYQAGLADELLLLDPPLSCRRTSPCWKATGAHRQYGFWSLGPVRLKIDAASTRARRLLAQKIADEAAALT